MYEFCSQYGFLRLLERDLAYRTEAPTLWDVDMKTAVAQAELEDRVIGGAYHRLVVHLPEKLKESGTHRLQTLNEI